MAKEQIQIDINPRQETAMAVSPTTFHGRLLLTVVTIGYIALLGLMLLHPSPWRLLGWIETGERVGRFSLLHFSIFVPLGFLTEMVRVRLSKRIVWSLLFLFAFMSELLQLYTGRLFEWGDLIQNMLGLACGLGAALFLKIGVK